MCRIVEKKKSPRKGFALETAFLGPMPIFNVKSNANIKDFLFWKQHIISISLFYFIVETDIFVILFQITKSLSIRGLGRDRRNISGSGWKRESMRHLTQIYFYFELNSSRAVSVCSPALVWLIK